MINEKKIRDRIHDLRNPLSTISGYSQLLKSKLKDDQKKEKEWVEEIFKACQKMEKLLQTK